jgi:hypothetical protein
MYTLNPTAQTFAVLAARGTSTIVIGTFPTEALAEGYRVREEPSGKVIRFYNAS